MDLVEYPASNTDPILDRRNKNRFLRDPALVFSIHLKMNLLKVYRKYAFHKINRVLVLVLCFKLQNKLYYKRVYIIQVFSVHCIKHIVYCL